MASDWKLSSPRQEDVRPFDGIAGKIRGHFHVSTSKLLLIFICRTGLINKTTHFIYFIIRAWKKVFPFPFEGEEIIIKKLFIYLKNGCDY